MEGPAVRVTAGNLPDHQVADLLEELQASGLDVRRDLPDEGPEGGSARGTVVATIVLAADPGDEITPLVVTPVRRWLDRHGHAPETTVVIRDPDGAVLREVQLEDVA